MGLVGRFVVSFRPIACDMLFGPLLTLFAVVVPAFGEHAGHPVHPHPHRGQRRRQKAVAPEGHRPRPTGLHPVSLSGRTAVSLSVPSPAATATRSPRRCAVWRIKSAFSDQRWPTGDMIVLDSPDFGDDQDQKPWLPCSKPWARSKKVADCAAGEGRDRASNPPATSPVSM